MRQVYETLKGIQLGAKETEGRLRRIEAESIAAYNALRSERDDLHKKWMRDAQILNEVSKERDTLRTMVNNIETALVKLSKSTQQKEINLANRLLRTLKRPRQWTTETLDEEFRSGVDQVGVADPGRDKETETDCYVTYNPRNHCFALEFGQEEVFVSANVTVLSRKLFIHGYNDFALFAAQKMPTKRCPVFRDLQPKENAESLADKAIQIAYAVAFPKLFDELEGYAKQGFSDAAVANILDKYRDIRHVDAPPASDEEKAEETAPVDDRCPSCGYRTSSLMHKEVMCEEDPRLDPEIGTWIQFFGGERWSFNLGKGERVVGRTFLHGLLHDRFDPAALNEAYEHRGRCIPLIPIDAEGPQPGEWVMRGNPGADEYRFQLSGNDLFTVGLKQLIHLLQERGYDLNIVHDLAKNENVGRRLPLFKVTSEPC